MKRLSFASLLAAAVVLASPAALAQNPFNSNDRSNDGAKDDAAKNEINVVPVAGGSTDIGFGGGYFAGFARVKPGYAPYVWNVESAALFTFKAAEGGGVAVPYQDVYVKLTVPRFLTPKLRLEVRPSYTNETTVEYGGLGNDSSAFEPPGAANGYLQYERMHPQVDVDLKWAFADHFIGRAGGRYVRNWLHVNAGSKLADDLQSGSPEVKSLLGPTADHSVVLFRYGVAWDTRDEETSTHQGTYDTLDVRLSPGGTTAFPYRYTETTLTGRVFVPIWKPRITLALRGVADLMTGDVPFYELSRFDDTFAIGGTNGVRGVPSGRYAGKVKAFGNVELRNEIVTFHALGKPMIFGVVAFFDAGRVWADTTPQPALDGTGIGLKYGVGGGLRLQSGSAFVLRADVAWSPDATPIGGYFSAGQAF